MSRDNSNYSGRAIPINFTRESLTSERPGYDRIKAVAELYQEIETTKTLREKVNGNILVS
ncbi:hypothetical protein KA107_03335 [Candidatus Pacearchaeota archaeon]|nr:hypothetical protein [Candidatus Pacearchaeota archaeon]